MPWNTPDLGSSDPENPLSVITWASSVYIFLSQSENFWILTSNTPGFRVRWPRVTSASTLFVITAPAASFLYIICQGFKILGFWPQMTSNTPRFGVRWPREQLFRNHVTKSSILIYKLSRFEKVWLLTPNDPKNPQVTPTPNLQNIKALLGPKLQFELFQALIGQLCNKIFEKQAETGNRL